MVLVLNLLCAVIDIALPLFQRYAIDHFIEARHSGGPAGASASSMRPSSRLQALAVILFTRGSMRIEMQLGRDMKRACFVHLQKLSLSYYNVTPVGYLLSRIMSDTNRIAGMIAWNLFDILWALFYVLGVFVAMFFAEPGPGGWRSCSSCRSSSLLTGVFPEPHPALEPPGAQDELAHHQRLQRGHHGRAHLQDAGHRGAEQPRVSRQSPRTCSLPSVRAARLIGRLYPAGACSSAR